MDDDDLYEEELAAVQAALDEQRWEFEEEESDYQALAGMGAIAYGLEQARQLRRERRYERRLYLTRPDLLPDPRDNTPWQTLFHSQSDRAFITTMGFDVVTFNLIRDSGFEEHWNSLPIPRADTSSMGRASKQWCRRRQ
jgi:hypothetical protein